MQRKQERKCLLCRLLKVMEEASLLHCLRVVSVLLLPLYSHGIGLPLRQGWEFVADVSLASSLPGNGYQLQTPSLFMPILSTSNFSSAKGFALGFFSLLPSRTSASARIFLSVCLGTNVTDHSGMAFAIPVWTWANEAHPLTEVGVTGKVSLRIEGSKLAGSRDLVLRDGDGSEVWRVEDVVDMELQDSGNWVLHNSANEVAWQTFDHPGDIMLQGQKLYVGMKLVSRSSVYVMEMKPGGLLFHMESGAPSPLYYFGFPLNASSILPYVLLHPFDFSRDPDVNLTAAFLTDPCPSGPEPYAHLMNSNITVEGSCISFGLPVQNTLANHSYDSDFLRLVDNGDIEGYTYLHTGDGENVLFSAQSNETTCLPPRACGSYSICKSYLLGSRLACQCPSAADDVKFAGAFVPVDPSDLTQGCARAVPLRCQAGSNSTFAVLNGKSMAPLHFLYETNYAHYTYRLDECRARCAANCSCAGFFFEDKSSFCLPFSDSGGLSNLSFLDINLDGPAVYVKIQASDADTRDHDSRLVGTPSSSQANNSKPQFLIPLVVALSAVIAAVLITGFAVLGLRRYRAHKRSPQDIAEVESDEGEDLQRLLPMLPTKFSFKELNEATKGFKNLLGKGAHSRVYDGVLQDGRRVAVKRLEEISPRRKQFLAEVAAISGSNHCNIVRLYGYCSQSSKRLLVYEYMENGSLDQWLFSKSPEQLLSWQTRFDIALGSARGLAYLHEDCFQPIIHFDVKPQNILLDKNFTPKVSDFGLAKLLEENSFVMTAVRGTPGYLAPEWISNSVVSKKCDVYGYGMVLFELLSGRRNTIQSLAGTEQWYFPTWAAVRCKAGGMLELVDKRLEGRFDEEQVKVIMHVAFICIQRDPHMRPTMRAVCKMLQGLVPINEKTPYSAALFDEPLFSETESSFASGSTFKEGR